MSRLTIILAIGCFLGAIALVILATRRRRRARDRNLAALAGALHFTYTSKLAGETPMIADMSKPFRSDAVGTFLARFAGCPVFAHGACRDVSNVLSGTHAEGEYLIFDYDYHPVIVPNDPDVVRATCVCVRSVAVNGHHVAARREGRLEIDPRLPVISSLMNRHPGNPVVATGHDAFDSHFVVRAAHRHDVQVLLTPAVRQYLLSLWHAHGRWYRHACIYDDLIIISEHSHAPVQHVQEMMQIAQQLMELINQ